MNPASRRAPLWAIAGVLLVLLAVRGIPVWRRWVAATQDEAWLARHELDRTATSIRSAPFTLDSITLLRVRYLALAPALMPGAPPGGASAALMSAVTGAASRPGVTLGSLQSVADSGPGTHFMHLLVRGDLTADIAGLAGFLDALAAGPALMAIREFGIEQAGFGEAGDPAALRVSFVIEGLAPRPEEAQP